MNLLNLLKIIEMVNCEQDIVVKFNTRLQSSFIRRTLLTMVTFLITPYFLTRVYHKTSVMESKCSEIRVKLKKKVKPTQIKTTSY